MEILEGEYYGEEKYRKRTVQVQLNPAVNSPNSITNSFEDIPLKITNFITIQIESQTALLGGFQEGSMNRASL